MGALVLVRNAAVYDLISPAIPSASHHQQTSCITLIGTRLEFAGIPLKCVFKNSGALNSFAAEMQLAEMTLPTSPSSRIRHRIQSVNTTGSRIKSVTGQNTFHSVH